jgi:hypothetical protein
VPHLAVDPRDAGDEPVGLDRAQNGARLRRNSGAITARAFRRT